MAAEKPELSPQQPIPQERPKVKIQTHEMSIGPDGKLYRGDPTPYGEVVTQYRELAEEARESSDFDPEAEDGGLWVEAVSQAIEQSRTGESHAGVLIMAGVGVGMVNANEWNREQHEEEFRMRDSRMGVVLELGDAEFGEEVLDPGRIEEFLNKRHGGNPIDRRLSNTEGMTPEDRLWNVRLAMRSATESNPLVTADQREAAQVIYSLARMEQDLLSEIKLNDDKAGVAERAAVSAERDNTAAAKLEHQIKYPLEEKIALLEEGEFEDIQDRGAERVTIRQIAPAMRALESVYPEMEDLHGSLEAWLNQIRALVETRRIAYPKEPLDWSVQMVAGVVYNSLDSSVRSALDMHSKREGDRVLKNNMQPDGFSGTIYVKPDKLFSNLMEKLYSYD